MSDTTPTNRERVKEIVKGIEDGIKKLFQSDKYADYLRTMSRFHSYSVNNTILIHMQKPNATQVAGFQKWKKQFGRHVKRGETGITILAPTPYKKKIEAEKLDPDTKLPMLDADGNTIMEEKVIEIPMFKPVKVFDVSQTEGKPLPNLATDLTGNVQHYEAFMEALRRTAPVPIEIKPIAGNMDGYFSVDAQKIVVQEGMSEIQTVCATVHEIGHSMLHNRKQAQTDAAAGLGQTQPKEKDRNTEEVEAESVSYSVCQYYGIETGENSFGYIASWSANRSLPELRASLETITKTANELISGIDKHFAEICKERGINLLDTQQQVVDAAERVQKQDAPETDAPDSPEKFALDYCDYMEKLHEAGIVKGSFAMPKETLAEEYAADVLRHGHFNGARDELTKLSRTTNSPTAASLLERLEKLSDAWDTTLTCSQRSYPLDDGTGPRSYILAYNKDAPNTDKEVVFLGPTDLCSKLMSELREGTTTLRQLRQRNQQYNNIPDRADAMIYENMEEQNTLFMVGDSYFLHVQTSGDASFDYSLYDANTMRLIDDGQLGIEGLGAFGSEPVEAAYSSILSSHGIAPVNVSALPIGMLESIEAANALPEPSASHTTEQVEHFPQEDAYLPDTTLDQYPVPDETMDDDALINAGYVGDDLLPLGENRACELSDQDMTVYMLHPGENPEMAFDSDEIREQPEGVLFAVPRDEWEASPAFRAAVAERMNHQEEREAAFLNHAGDCFAIYQIKLDNDERRHYLRYEHLDRLEEPPRKSDYELAYTAPLPEGATLDTLFRQFNVEHPADFQRPSMSVSDIVALNRGGVVTYHYCDSTDFKELPEFGKPDNYLRAAELSMEDDANMIDGIINNGPKKPTVEELEAQVKAGRSISLMDLASAVHAERKPKPRAAQKRASVLGKLNKPLPMQNKKNAPKKSAEKER